MNVIFKYGYLHFLITFFGFRKKELQIRFRMFIKLNEKNKNL